jgi:RimJ/RimL family protein N-acetyltransferase
VIENGSGEIVGELTTHHSDPSAGAFAYGIAIRREHRRRGYAFEAITLVLRYDFRELRYQKATVSVYKPQRGVRAALREARLPTCGPHPAHGAHRWRAAR